MGVGALSYRSYLRFLAVLATLAMVAALVWAPPAEAGPGRSQESEGVLWLTVLHNNDGESALLPRQIVQDDTTLVHSGAALFKARVDQLRGEATSTGPARSRGLGVKRGVLMLSSGDNFLAGPQFAASLEMGVPFFDTILMDLVGYDAVAIGNHEFDFGPDVLADFIVGFSDPVPFLSANLDVSAEPSLAALGDRIAKSVVVTAGGERIGVIGATTPRLPFISSPRNVVVDTDVAGAVQAEVDRLQAMGVSKIILISHLQSIQEDLELALELSGVDVMIAGGGDELLANPDDPLLPGDEGIVFGPYPLFATDADGNEIPVVTTTGAYGYVGRLIVGFDRHGEILHVDGRSGPVRVTGEGFPDGLDPDPEVVARVEKPVADFVADLAATVIGSSQVPLNSLRGSASLVDGKVVVTVPGKRVSEVNVGDLVADALLWQAQQLAGDFGVEAPTVALQNGGGIRADFVHYPGATPGDPADVTLLDTFGLLPFPNFVSVVEGISAARLKVILENAVSRVEFVDGRFAQVAGFRFEWDSSRQPRELDPEGNVITEGERVRKVVVGGTTIVENGMVVAPEFVLHVATIDFLARGGDQYPFGDAPFTTLGVTYQQALANYLTGPLGGLISEGAYPEGGTGRIVQLDAP